METLQKCILNVIIAVILVSVVGCANMSRRDQCTAIGAGVGAVAGSVLTEGSGVGTVGGAAVGGVIGNRVRCR